MNGYHRYSDREVAAVVHAANTALQEIQGDESPSGYRLSGESPETQASAINGVRTARNGATPEQMHEAWREHKASQGWSYGPEKDPDKRTHPCMVPYGELPEDQKDKDRLFLAITTALTMR